MYIANVQNTYAMVVGVVLLLVGLLGFVSNPILGLFGVNMLQNVLHLVGGALGLWLGMKGNAKAFNMWFGVVALAAGVLGFVPGVSDMLVSLLNVNAQISVLHVVLGVVSLGVVYGLKK